MAFDYAEFAEIAVELLEEFGQAGQLERPTSTGPAHTPVAGAPLLYDATFVIRKFKTRDIDGTRILATDKIAVISPNLTVEPKTSDLLREANGSKFRFVTIDPIRPATMTIAYIAQVRR